MSQGWLEPNGVQFTVTILRIPHSGNLDFSWRNLAPELSGQRESAQLRIPGRQTRGSPFIWGEIKPFNTKEYTWVEHPNCSISYFASAPIGHTISSIKHRFAWREDRIEQRLDGTRMGDRVRRSCAQIIGPTAVFLLRIPDISIEGLDKSSISRWSPEVLATVLRCFLFEIETLES